ncbi:MAG: DUF2090 domain-containing protein [Gammaproteobacteria bacterium]|nr:MAG: DUF2090 domain-containing protein [Gammaproteobacteria bacterium]
MAPTELRLCAMPSARSFGSRSRSSGQPRGRSTSRPRVLAAHLEPWPAALTVKCLCLYHPDDRAELRGAQERNLLRLAAACRAQQRELLLEIAAGGLG